MNEQRKRSNIDVPDRITALPDSLKELILDCLPIEDAVRTSVLSTNWRYTWTVRKQLDFGQDFLSVVGDISGVKYAAIIDKMLLMHHGPLQLVSIQFPSSVSAVMLDLSVWMLNWSRKGIQQLDINARPGFDDGYGLFPLPSWLFQCHSLKTMGLICCALNPPTDNFGFLNLVTLNLTDVAVSSDSLGTLISRCGQLEELYIATHQAFDTYFLTEALIVDAPNLRMLTFLGFTSVAIILKNVPRLADFCLLSSAKLFPPLHLEHPQLYSALHVFDSLRGVENMTFDMSLLKLVNGDCPNSLLTPLSNLKMLSLCCLRISEREEITFLFCLLRSVPRLKELRIDTYQDSNHSREVLECLEVEGVKALNLNQLLTVVLTLFEASDEQMCDCEPMLKFIKILLSGCPILDTIFIAPEWGEGTDAVKLKWVTRLLEFPRLSSNAKVIFWNPY